jgi:tRNA A-37 threonylcarbamoyl transferase component Bud32
MQMFSCQTNGYKSHIKPTKIDTQKIIKKEKKCLIWAERLEDDTQAIVKMYYRKGILNFIRAKILNFRVQREYKALRQLEYNAIPCSIPLFWTYGYCKEYGFYEILCTRLISNIEPLMDFLDQTQLVKEDFGLAVLFKMMYRMHTSGVYHGALSSKNVLVNAAGNTQLQYYIIDLAHSRLFTSSIFGKMIAWYDILTLFRSIENKLGIGYCKPYLTQYGLGENAIKNFFQKSKPHRAFSRKQKRIKIILKFNILILALMTKFALEISRLKLFLKPSINH